MTDYPIPHASAEAWKKHSSKSPQNPGLIFERFAPDWRDQPTVKRGGLDQVVRASERVDGRLLEAWNARWGRAARAAGADPFTMKTEWRLVVGLGRKGSLEVGFTFHRYGFPILPGSSLKGVARAAGLLTVAEEFGAVELENLGALLSLDDGEQFRKHLSQQHSGVGEAGRRLAERFRAIFGTTGGAGRAVFFDAIPSRRPQLDLDIMNPHFPQYYADHEAHVAPTDRQNPRPVYFLAVAPGAEFRFAVGWRHPRNGDNLALRELARGWLVMGLTGLGVGAKTSAGYGYFSR